MFYKNKKKGNALSSFVPIIIVILSFLSILFVTKELMTAGDNYLEGADMCLMTIKASNSEYMSKDFGSLGKVQLFKQKCSTQSKDFSIQRKDLNDPNNETQRQNALFEKVAKRIAYTWYMVGAGSVKDFWADKGMISQYLDGFVQKSKCVIFTDFKIEESDYFPKDPVYTGDIIPYMYNNEFAVYRNMQQRDIISYYDYVHLFNGVESGGLFVYPIEFIQDQTYAIALFTPPEKFDTDFLFSCVLAVAVGVGGPALVAAGGSVIAPVAGAVVTTGNVVLGPMTGTVAVGAAAVGAVAGGIYITEKSAEACGKAIGAFVTDNPVAVRTNFDANFRPGDYTYKSTSAEFMNGQNSFLFMGLKQSLKSLGCVEIEGGVVDE